MAMRFKSSLAAALSVALVLAGCAGQPVDRPVSTAAAVNQAVIPFVEAQAHAEEEGGYRLRWSAPAAAGAVTVLAGLQADGRDGRIVAHGGSAGDIRIASPGSGQRWYFTLKPEAGAPLTIADRGLGLVTAPNFRDAGGYRTTDGRWVRMGAIYRSDQMDRISTEDMATITALGLDLVIDLRTEKERTREPDRLPPGAAPLVLDVMQSTGEKGGDIDRAMEAIASGRGAEFLIELNRDFVVTDSARKAYHALVARVSAAPLRFVYHCTAGKDRTGWATAVLLTALGVPRETVFADYLASNSYLADKNAASYAKLAPLTREQLEPILTVRREYLEAAFTAVDRRYGSFDAYLRDGLGLDSAALQAMRDRYLVGASAGARE